MFGGQDNNTEYHHTNVKFLLFPRLISVIGNMMLGWINLFSNKCSHSYFHNFKWPNSSENNLPDYRLLVE